MDINIKEMRAMIDMMRRANPPSAILISIAMFIPAVLVIWFGLLNRVPLLNQHDDWKLGVVGVLFFVLVGAIAWLIVAQQRERKLETMKDLVQVRLKKKGGRASFDFIRASVEKKYQDKDIQRLIARYPKTFGKCEVKAEGRTKDGITLVPAESDDAITINEGTK